jgi:hypothetical protein
MLSIVNGSLLLERVQLRAPLLTLVVSADSLFHQLQDLRLAVHKPLKLVAPNHVEELSGTLKIKYLCPRMGHVMIK